MLATRVRGAFAPLAGQERPCLSTPFCPSPRPGGARRHRRASAPGARVARQRRPPAGSESMAETAPEAPEEMRGGSQRKTDGFDPVQAVRTFVQSFPWLVIAIAAHAIVLAILAVWKLGHGDGKKDDSVVITATLKKNELVDDTEEKKEDLIDRTAIPENLEAELVPNEVAQLLPTESPVDPNRDLTQDIGDPNSSSDMPNSDPTGGTSVGVGQGGHHGSGTPSAFAGRKLGTGVRK